MGVSGFKERSVGSRQEAPGAVSEGGVNRQKARSIKQARNWKAALLIAVLSERYANRFGEALLGLQKE